MEFLSSLWQNLLFLPFLNLLIVLYGLLGENLGLAVIVLAVIIRLLLVRSTRKQTEMTRKMAEIKPKLEQIQKKYKNDTEKLAKEQMKLYRETGYNPVGCLGTFLPQIFILAAIFGVIRIITEGEIVGLYGFVQDFVFGTREAVISDAGLNFLGMNLHDSYIDLKNAHGYFSLEALPYLILGIVVGAAQFVSTMFMQTMSAAQNLKPASKSKNKDEQMSPEEVLQQLMNSMTKIFPLLTAYITISAPAVLGVYWVAQSIMFVAQYFIIDKEKSVETAKKLLSKK